MAGINLKERHVAIAASPHLENQNGSIIVTKKALAMPVKSLVVGIEPVQAGSGDPSPENVRPISGWTGANVANISDSEKQPYFAGLLNGTYGFVDLGTLTWTYDPGNMQFYSNKIITMSGWNYNVICSAYKSDSRNSVQYYEPHVRGIAKGEIYIVDPRYTDATAFAASLSGVQLVYELNTPTTPTITLAQYNQLLASFNLGGWLIPISWQSEAGTVYGGTLDVTTGLLTVDRGMVDLGTLSASGWQYDSNRKGFTHVFTPPANENIMCSSYPIGVYADWANTSKTNLIFYIKAVNAIYLKTPDYTDGASLSAALSGVQLVYELATPITYQPSPTEVALLLGENNVWADTGDITMKFWSH